MGVHREQILCTWQSRPWGKFFSPTACKRMSFSSKLSDAKMRNYAFACRVHSRKTSHQLLNFKSLFHASWAIPLHEAPVRDGSAEILMSAIFKAAECEFQITLGEWSGRGIIVVWAKIASDDVVHFQRRILCFSFSESIIHSLPKSILSKAKKLAATNLPSRIIPWSPYKILPLVSSLGVNKLIARAQEA